MADADDRKRMRWDDSHNLTVPEVDEAAFPIARPLEDREMEWVSRRWTVCQILRELYHAVDHPALKLKCRVASNMAKVMVEEILVCDPEWGKHRWPWREKACEEGSGRDG